MDISKYKHLGDILPVVDQAIRKLLSGEFNYTANKVDIIAVNKVTQELVTNAVYVAVMGEDISNLVTKVANFCSTLEKRLALELFLQEISNDPGSDVV